MKYKSYCSSLLCVLAVLYLGSLWADGMKMPMRFKYDANPGEILKTYPLGSLNKLAVLSHHGKADKEVRLPNGREGWVYDMSIHRVPRTYITPDGEKQVVNEREKSGVQQVYTLVFGDDGYVIDVLYQDKSSGMSALQIQHDSMMKH